MIIESAYSDTTFQITHLLNLEGDYEAQTCPVFVKNNTTTPQDITIIPWCGSEAITTKCFPGFMEIQVKKVINPAANTFQVGW